MNAILNSLRVIAIVAVLGTSSSAFAHYLVVTPEQVVATSEGLFVNINDLSIEVESLNAANDGLLVAIPVPSPYAAICPSCGEDTYTPGRTCSSCGFPIWDGDLKKMVR